MKSEQFFKKSSYANFVQDKFDKTIAKFTYYDMIEFAEEYAGLKLAVLDRKKKDNAIQDALIEQLGEENPYIMKLEITGDLKEGDKF